MTSEAAGVEDRAGTHPWWLVLLEGIALIIVGVLLLASTEKTLVILVQFIGIYWLIRGIFDIVSIFVDRTAWGWKLFMGIVGIIAGLVILQHPLWSAVLVPTVTVWILGIYGIIAGAVGIVRAFQGAGWGAGVLGAVAILIGIFFLANTLISAVALVWVTAIAAIVGGIAAVVMAFRLR
ncbi:MAG: HdeD family acid-resistance protein [Chloroflexota bacterium]|nr:MAG: HdeD family acid-resistance protein [Chloroflexota bacterium]